MSTLTARGLAEARHLLLSDLDASEHLPVTEDMDTFAVGAYMSTANRDHLFTADLFAVSPDACFLAAHAAPDLPSTYRPPLVDIPVRSGLLVWEDPQTHVPDTAAGDRPIPIVAASWHVGLGRSGQMGVTFILYTSSSAGRAFPAWRSPLAPIRMGSLVLGDGRPADPLPVTDPDTDRTIRVLLTTWLLMHQGATDEAAAPAPPERTRLARTLAKRGRPLPDVRVVDLHRPADGPAASSGRTVSVRYAVRGHWRNQAYGPGRELRRPVWVHPHVRGPEDAPWSTGTTVARLRAPGPRPAQDGTPADGTAPPATA